MLTLRRTSSSFPWVLEHNMAVYSTHSSWQYFCMNIINRPGVAGAVLQSPLWLIKWLSDWVILKFKYIASTVNLKPEELGSSNFGECSSHTMCHVSPFTCHFFSSLKKLDKVVELVGGASVINKAYPINFISPHIFSQIKYSV